MSTFKGEESLLPINDARAEYRQGWVDEFERQRAQAERLDLLPRFHKSYEKFGGIEGAIDHYSSDDYFGTTPLGKRYRDAGLLGGGM